MYIQLNLTLIIIKIDKIITKIIKIIIKMLIKIKVINLHVHLHLIGIIVIFKIKISLLRYKILLIPLLNLITKGVRLLSNNFMTAVLSQTTNNKNGNRIQQRNRVTSFVYCNFKILQMKL